MEKTIKINGMMCPHCEATVKKCLEAFPQVTSAEVSHEKGTAVIQLNAEISDAIKLDTNLICVTIKALPVLRAVLLHFTICSQQIGFLERITA